MTYQQTEIPCDDISINITAAEKAYNGQKPTASMNGSKKISCLSIGKTLFVHM